MFSATEIFALEAETAPFSLTDCSGCFAVCRPFADLICTDNVRKSMLCNSCLQRTNGLKPTCKIVACVLWHAWKIAFASLELSFSNAVSMLRQAVFAALQRKMMLSRGSTGFFLSVLQRLLAVNSWFSKSCEKPTNFVFCGFSSGNQREVALAKALCKHR